MYRKNEFLTVLFYYFCLFLYPITCSMGPECRALLAWIIWLLNLAGQFDFFQLLIQFVMGVYEQLQQHKSKWFPWAGEGWAAFPSDSIGLLFCHLYDIFVCLFVLSSCSSNWPEVAVFYFCCYYLVACLHARQLQLNLTTLYLF